MASKTNSTSLALILIAVLNILFFSVVSGASNPNPKPTLATSPKLAPTVAPTPTSDPNSKPTTSTKCPDLRPCGFMPLSGACCVVFAQVTDATAAASCICNALKDSPAGPGQFLTDLSQLISFTFVQCGRAAPSNLTCSKY